MILELLALCGITAASWAAVWPMLFPRAHPRYVAPAVIADIPNTTFRGGLL